MHLDRRGHATSSMKSFFIRAGARIGRFFWSWGFLKFVLGVTTLIVVFYMEEDWRGAHAWAVTKAKWEAQGESLDYKTFIPPPVPDDQNLAALPLFKLYADIGYDGSTYMEDRALRDALRTAQPEYKLPAAGKWQQGELPDMGKIRPTIAAHYAKAFKGVTPLAGALEQFDAIYPFLSELRAAAATRPLFRVNENYDISPPALRPLGLITDQMRLSRILVLHAILALDDHQAELALQDLKLNYQILSGVQRDPSVVGGLVAIAMNVIGSSVVFDGLASHAWSDAQLAELEQMLEPIDFLTGYQFDMRSESAVSAANFESFKKQSFKKHSSLGDIPGFPLPSFPHFLNGWYDSNKAGMANTLLGATSWVDPKAHRVFVDQAEQGEEQTRRFVSHWTALRPGNILFLIATPPLLHSLPHFIRGQGWVDQTRIACALERYRLAHGVYPDALAALVPADIDALPCDPINGEAYRYRVRPDGTFLLYSVGWKQTDDGGVAVYVLDNPTGPDDSVDKHGDWVWPTAK